MTVITRPADIELTHFHQIIELILKGGQVRREGLHERIMRADLVAYKLQNNKVICTATLKNPSASYRTKVFNLAKATSSINFKKELGYIVTHPDFENCGHCQNLLKEFFIKISEYPIYATTRKHSMIYILGKFGFQ